MLSAKQGDYWYHLYNVFDMGIEPGIDTLLASSAGGPALYLALSSKHHCDETRNNKGLIDNNRKLTRM